MTGKSAVLKTQNLSIRFGGHVAVNEVSASFEAGTLTAIVGPNGAGKTTYFNLLSGQLRATSGSVVFNGVDITRLGAAQRTQMGIGRAFQLTNLFPQLSVLENVRLAVQSRERAGFNMLAVWRQRSDLIERAEHYLDMVGLSGRSTDTVVGLPHGDKRKLEVAMLMALEPQILMFDEPTAGMSVDEVPVILKLIQRLKDRGDRTILLVEHKLDVIRTLADRIVVLHNGQVVADGDPTEVMASPVVQEAYLGAKVVAHA
ncbi:ABC transporter ATP-binding protein [Polaromonas sp. P2-4]|nr:ABC transporter ATP-binding protein [Polaromonas sp. P2-4]